MDLTMILQHQHHYLSNGIRPVGISPPIGHISCCLGSRRKRTTVLLHQRKSIKMTTFPINPTSSSSLSIVAAKAASGVPPLDLTEDNVRQVLADARVELSQLFDTSVGMTGVAELAELDGPFVRISLRGRFWHKRSTVLARLANYLKHRIPEILEVDIEDEKQLDDSPANF